MNITNTEAVGSHNYHFCNQKSSNISMSVDTPSHYGFKILYIEFYNLFLKIIIFEELVSPPAENARALILSDDMHSTEQLS